MFLSLILVVVLLMSHYSQLKKVFLKSKLLMDILIWEEKISITDSLNSVWLNSRRNPELISKEIKELKED